MKSSAPFSTPESRAALEQLKEFVRVNSPAGKIEAHAFRLVGESQETIDRETRELFEALRQQSPPLLRRSEAFGLRRSWFIRRHSTLVFVSEQSPDAPDYAFDKSISASAYPKHLQNLDSRLTLLLTSKKCHNQKQREHPNA